MSDVLQTAQKYRNRLNAEIAKMDDFLRFAAELTKDSAPQAYTPQADATPKTMSPEPRVEEPSRPVLDGAAANQSQATSAPEKNKRKSLFRGAFEPIESGHIKDAA